jgi:hypothetical protein
MSPRSFIVLEDSNDYARCSRDTKFKSMVLREIRVADDNHPLSERDQLAFLQPERPRINRS